MASLQSQWSQAESLFLAAADLPRAEQLRFLDEACADDAELRSNVESLIGADHGSTRSIASAVEQEASRWIDCQSPGDLLGAYRIVRELGRGGMGAVFLASRDDAQYEKLVAIKVVKRGMDTAEVLQRFRYERQILANLDHPNIAHLFDGGTTSDGRPFFVMEYIAGQPVDQFCRERDLDLKSRLRLFLRVCNAVAYAHRNLVVHRDLKPANILINGSGEPKLLDFGVAKLLGGNSGFETVVTMRLFTPDYASPEQVMGLPVTTASDIYSLGAVLYELLTGEPAHRVTEITPLALEFAICTAEVTRPSLISRNIDADLDNIVLMAMRKEPERRYPSADQMAADIQRYLNGEPVVARQNSFLYRARKFARRHAREVAAGVAVAASLIAATVISGAQYRRAEAERLVAVHERSRAEAESRQAEVSRQSQELARHLADGERDEAQRQRALAEQRVTDLIDLANRTLFDVHSSIESLPGAIAARRKIVDTTVGYLERLEKSAGSDGRVRQALSVAYYKVAMIQGDVYAPSLQDFAGAGASLAKAEALLKPLYLASPNDPALMLRWIEIENGQADLIYRSGRREAAAAAYEKLLPIAVRLGRLRPGDVECAKQEALLHWRLAVTTHYFNVADGLDHANRQMALMFELMNRFPKETNLKQEFGVALATAAAAVAVSGELDRAAEFYRRSIQVREELAAADQNNVGLQQSLIVVYGNYAGLLGVPWAPNLGRAAEARAAAGRAVAIARTMVAADPQDATARFNLSMSLSRLGAIDPEPGGAAQSLAILKEAIGLLEPVAKANPKSANIAVQLATTCEYAGHRLKALHRDAEAAEQYQASLATAEAFLSSGSSSALAQVTADQEALALLYASQGDRTRAMDMARRAVSGATQRAASLASDLTTGQLARAKFVFASVYAKFAEWPDARRLGNEALDLWKPIRNPGVLSMHRQEIDEAEALAHQ